MNNTEDHKRLKERVRQQTVERQMLLSKAFKVDKPNGTLEIILAILAIGVIATGITLNVTLKTEPSICYEKPGKGTLEDPIIGAFKPCQQTLTKTAKIKDSTRH